MKFRRLKTFLFFLIFVVFTNNLIAQNNNLFEEIKNNFFSKKWIIEVPGNFLSDKKIIKDSFDIDTLLFVNDSILKMPSDIEYLFKEGNYDTFNYSQNKSEKNSAYIDAFIKPVTITASPNASSLTSQVKDDVDLYTGRISVSYPIFDLSTNNISLPITLDYSSSGLKVNDISSWVGIGWNLNAGGVISRNMNGIPDEFDGTMTISEDQNSYEYPVYGYLRFMENINNDSEYFSPNRVKSMEQMRLVELLENSNMSGNIYNLETTTEGWDTQPDDFYFNFAGYSGKIIFNADGEAITVPHYNLKALV
ncbi:MAG: hypothetical protein JXL97_04025 [Bacteroidales bacterium]|nr:hypothetical protein [Bacteroidales bacterium]